MEELKLEYGRGMGIGSWDTFFKSYTLFFTLSLSIFLIFQPSRQENHIFSHFVLNCLEKGREELNNDNNGIFSESTFYAGASVINAPLCF